MSVTAGEHRFREFDADLQNLTSLIAEMGGWAERQIVEAIDALMKRDRERAQRMVTSDATIDALQQMIEERVVSTIATRRPMAVDLRGLVGILRISNELERIGDLAKNIGKRAVTLNGQDMPRQALRGVDHMASLAIRQLHDVLDSLAHRDATTATAVRNRDEEIDVLYTSLFRELLISMREDPGLITFGIHMLFCAKNIERMGDHATNIAEAICYMIDGRSFAGERPKADSTATITGERLAAH